MKKRYHLIFTGRVQGVGFRYSAQKLALEYDVTGWVKNLYDGSVEMEAQGKESFIKNVINELKNEVFVVIDDIIMEELFFKENENGFVIVS